MKPALGSKKLAMAIALLVGGFAFWWYLKPFIWLGMAMGVLAALFVYFILTTRKMETFRRFFFIGLFAFTLISFFTIIDILNPSWFLPWVSQHQGWLEYYKPGESLGTIAYPCTRVISQVFLGRAAFWPAFGVWEAVFPPTFWAFMLTLVPYIVTALIFGRGICGWICPFGGLSEAMVTGNKERWQLGFLKKQGSSPGFSRYSGLKEWMKDFKYGILVAVILLSIFLSFPLVCTFCPVLWLSSMPVFWLVIGLIVVFAILLPFMTKRRWWCHICPIGAVFSLVDRISLFKVRIDKDKCSRCMDCVQVCRMYAITMDDVKGKGIPSADCIRCGRCIEACPEQAIDICWFGRSSSKARGIFITLIVIGALLWYTWLVVIMADRLAGLI